MSLESNIILNVYSAVILLVIYIHAQRFSHKESAQERLFLAVLYITFALLGLDILSRFDGNAAGYAQINAFGNFVIFIMVPTIPSLWVSYVHLQVFGDEQKAKQLHFGFLILHIVNAVIVILSQFYGWVYFIDSSNVYHRGPIFWFPVLITVVLMLAALAILYKNRGRLERKKYLSLLFFAIPPSIAIVLQSSSMGYPCCSTALRSLFW